MPNIYVKATPLSNVGGRLNYISSEKKQEHMEAFYNSADAQYWQDLSLHCRKAAAEAGHEKACEARELIVQLANDLAEEMEPQFLAESIAERIHELTGTETAVAIHWNKTKTNYHAHIIFSENEECNVIKEGAVLRQNTYFDADGKRSTKSKCVDPETRELLPGCEMIPKGGRKIEKIRFAKKNEYLKSKEFLAEAKEELAVLQNTYLEEIRFRVFKDDGLHLKQQHIGKGLPPEKEDAIKAKNKASREFNATVDELLELSEPEGENANLEAKNSIQTVRDDMKKWAMTERWTECVQFYQRKLNTIVERVKAYFHELQEQEEFAPRGIDDIIEHGRRRQNVPPIRRTGRPTQRQQSREREWDMDL